MHFSMLSRTFAGLIMAAVAGWALPASQVGAQVPTTAPSPARPEVPAAPPERPASGAPVKQPEPKSEPKARPVEPQNVTLTGRLVDLHSFMTGSYPSQDRAKTTAERLKAGVPAGLDTAAGLILLGMGPKNPVDRLAPLAYEEVEVKGKLHYRRGARYLEFTNIGKAKPIEFPGAPARPPTIGGGSTTQPAAR